MTLFVIPSPDLAVVPIFVNAGAALLPAIIAGLTSAAALIFKPRELFALFRRRPLLPIGILAAVVAIYFFWSWIAGRAAPEPGRASASAPAASSGTDWAKIALEILRQEDPAKRISGTAPILCGPAFTGTHVYAASQNGWLAVFNAANGTILEKHYLNAADKPGELGLSFSSPWFGDGRVYIEPVPKKRFFRTALPFCPNEHFQKADPVGFGTREGDFSPIPSAGTKIGNFLDTGFPDLPDMIPF